MKKNDLTQEQKKEVKRLRVHSIAFLLTYYFFVAVLPIVFISTYFDLFKKVGKYKPTGIMLIALIMIAIFFKNQAKRFMKSLKPGELRTFITSCFIPVLLIIMLLIVWWASNSIYQLKMVLFLSIISNIIAVPFNVLFTKCNMQKKELLGEDENEKHKE